MVIAASSIGLRTFIRQPAFESPTVLQEIKIFVREIFDIGCAAGFSSTVSLYRPLWGFHRPPAESVAGNPGIRRHDRFARCKTNAVHAFENC